MSLLGRPAAARRALVAINLFLVLGLGMGVLGCERAPGPRATRAARGDGSEHRARPSNVLRADYVGSAACAPCHADVSARWAASPMHRMTRTLPAAEVHAPFDGARLAFQGEYAQMTTRAGERYLRLISPERGDATYRLTRVIGGRYREDFAGIEVRAVGAYAPVEGAREQVLPVTWVHSTQEWRYKGYSVQIPERPWLSVGPDWSRTCLFCHNTTPLLTTLYDELGSAHTYQGSAPSNLLPDERRLRYEVVDEAGLARAVDDELALLHVRSPPRRSTLREWLAVGVRATRARYGAEQLVEVGIGCEACHGGARAHALDPTTPPAYGLVSPLFTVHGPRGELSRAEAINHTCARCHSVLFSWYPFTWEGGQRRRDPGGSTVNSGEGRDFLLGGCASELRCTQCHDAHGEDDERQLARLEVPEGNDACTTCHSELGSDGPLSAHTRHDPSGEGAACVNCHMPRKNAGLDYGLTRYHRIGSPTDDARLHRDRPIECALCHGERSVEALATSLERGWGTRVDRAALRRLYGADLERPIMELTLARGRPHEQTVAIDWMGRSGDERYVPLLVEQLGNVLPLNRYFAREAITRIRGSRPELDMSLPGPRLVAAARALLALPEP